MTARPEQRAGQPRSTYEDFTNRPFYVEINRKTVSFLPPSRTVIDIATGTGAIVQQMIEQNKLLPRFWVNGFDIDPVQLQTAEKKFGDVEGGIVKFELAPAEKLPVPDNYADAVTFCNAAHLTDLPISLSEAYRVLKPGKPLALNTAYTKDLSYPEGSRRTWGIFVALARKIAEEKYGLKNLEPPKDILKYSSEDIKEMAEKAGFTNISIGFITARMNREDLEAIGEYSEFAQGALPGVKYEIATECLKQAVPEMLQRRNADSLPRGWIVMYAFKKDTEFPAVPGI